MRLVVAQKISGWMEMDLLMLSSVNSIYSMIDLKAACAVIIKGSNSVPCVDPRLGLTFEKDILGGLSPL